MALEPEEMALPGLMRGLNIVVEYMRGPEPRAENIDRVLNEGETLSGQAEARTETLYFEAHSSYGIEVSKERGSGNTKLIPWSAVLAMYTMENREGLIQMAKEDIAAGEDGQMQEGNPS